jgi:hypothetical protein
MNDCFREIIAIWYCTVHADSSLEMTKQLRLFNTTQHVGKRDLSAPVTGQHVKKLVFLVPVQARSWQVNGSAAFDSDCYICVQLLTCPCLRSACSCKLILTLHSFASKMEATGCTETLVPFYPPHSNHAPPRMLYCYYIRTLARSTVVKGGGCKLSAFQQSHIDPLKTDVCLSCI